MAGNISCPIRFNCSNGNYSFDIGVSPSYVSIFSCSLSCMGSLVILLTFCLLKDLRTTATQKIITFLAMADLISAFGYILGSVNFLTHFQETDSSKCKIFRDLCTAQSAITTWSSLVSFCWTVILAFHFFLIIVYKRFQLAGKLIPLYCIIAWGVPLLIVVPLLATDKLGYSPYATSNWCYVKEVKYSALREDGLAVALILVAGKGWEFISYVSVSLLYLFIFCDVHQTRYQLRNTQISSRVLQVEWRLLAIPILFILLRIWGTIQFIVSLSLPPGEVGHCISETLHNTFVSLGILQAFGDGGQGLGNFILYILLSPTIRARLCGSICGVCLEAVESRLGGMLETDTATRTPENRQVHQLNVNKNDNSSSSLLPHRPATGYLIRKYDSTSSCSDQAYTGANYEREAVNSTTA